MSLFTEIFLCTAAGFAVVFLAVVVSELAKFYRVFMGIREHYEGVVDRRHHLLHDRLESIENYLIPISERARVDAHFERTRVG